MPNNYAPFSQYIDVRCSQCRERIGLNVAICPQCHAGQGLEALAGIDPNVHIKNQNLTIWFGLLFGVFGVHQFYLGHYVRGSLYLVFCWTLVPMIVGWVDAVRTLTMSTFKFNQRYCRRATHDY